VAASGGYMMACCADRLVASPFAVLGSIGVISEQPNVYDRLKREGIEFQTVTAGKFKRTLTPFKKPTTEDFAKNKEDIEKVLVLFKNFVASQRPQLDIDAVATGETWFGADALARGLCDELKTTDDVLLELRATGDPLPSSTTFDRSPSNYSYRNCNVKREVARRQAINPTFSHPHTHTH
jgi:ClpP class serine protease